ncbi:MAG: molecular chaperone TorD family protein [Candidatus Hydrogenedentes bacterium]|nr:molecular chaperone TorD family protein [Candidatus Hydrogenedentota bacterium]
MSSFEHSAKHEFDALAPARQSLYSSLSQAFYAPPVAHPLPPLLNPDFLDAIGPFVSPRVMNTLRPWAAEAGADDQWASKTKQEFMRLFKVPGEDYVKPYESVYRDSREIGKKKVAGLLMGQCATDVKKWYQLAAVEVSGEYQDLHDHIALELNFLSHLCKKEQEFIRARDTVRLRRCREMQRDFLAGHVIKWIGLLRDRIWEKTNHPYYRGVADFTVDFINSDLNMLESHLGAASVSSGPPYRETDARASTSSCTR